MVERTPEGLFHIGIEPRQGLEIFFFKITNAGDGSFAFVGQEIGLSVSSNNTGAGIPNIHTIF